MIEAKVCLDHIIIRFRRTLYEKRGIVGEEYKANLVRKTVIGSQEYFAPFVRKTWFLLKCDIVKLILKTLARVLNTEFTEFHRVPQSYTENF